MSNPFASYLKQESTPCTVEIQFKIGNKSVQKLAAVCLGRGEKAAKAGAFYTFFFFHLYYLMIWKRSRDLYDPPPSMLDPCLS